MKEINYQEKQQQNHLNAFLKVVDPTFIKYYQKIRKNTMLSTEALYDLWWSVKYICKNELNGDIIEFGVWRGGALELIAYALNEYQGSNRIIGFDTFEGHPEPGKDEVDIWGNNMQKKFKEEKVGKWAYANYEYVLSNLNNVYKNVQLYKGLVDESIDENKVSNIAILRLDMDWYKPTKIVLQKFYNKILKGGLLIIDDYGHHSGARQAVDEFIRENNLNLNFRHVNYSCIVANIL